MHEALHQRRISVEIIIGEKQYSLWYQHKKNKFSHSNYTWRSCSLLTSAVIAGVQMGEMSKLVWLIGWSSRDMLADASLISKLALYFTLVSCLVYSQILKMEATYSSEISVCFQQTTRRYIPEDITLNVFSCCSPFYAYKYQVASGPNFEYVSHFLHVCHI
jgi:hypothetical protein